VRDERAPLPEEAASAGIKTANPRHLPVRRRSTEAIANGFGGSSRAHTSKVNCAFRLRKPSRSDLQLWKLVPIGGRQVEPRAENSSDDPRFACSSTVRQVSR
jgi:hypothetical protein